MQDVSAPRPAQPCLQGDLRLPGGAVPAVRRHTHGVHLQPAQHEAQGDGGLDRSGPEQQRRGGAAPLAGHEGEPRTAGLPLARPPGGVAPPAGRRSAPSIPAPLLSVLFLLFWKRRDSLLLINNRVLLDLKL